MMPLTDKQWGRRLTALPPLCVYVHIRPYLGTEASPARSRGLYRRGGPVV